MRVGGYVYVETGFQPTHTTPHALTHTGGCLYIFYTTPEDGHEPCPKHVE